MSRRAADTDSKSIEPPSKRAKTGKNDGNTLKAASVPSKPEKAEESDDEQKESEDLAETADGGRARDLYLDTVNRAVLDFDFEKLCSISLSNINIYGCLVCGKYFQGRGRSSYAYAHSIHDDHHVFINLETLLVYVLPDGYQVQDPSLDDISAVLNPTFTRAQVAALSNFIQNPPKPSFDLTSKQYIPGYVGLNNIKANDYLNVIIHSLLHVAPLRDFLLLSNFGAPSISTPEDTKSPPSGIVRPRPPTTELLRRFAALAKKVWNPRLFKAQVSPHEFLQEVGRVSGGKFKITQQGDPVEFLGWLLNQLHKDLGGSKKKNSSIIYSTFQGEVKMETQQVIVKGEDEGAARPVFDINQDIKTVESPFLFLAIDLPPPPLFQDTVEKNIIPQVTLASVLAKYDGKTTQEFAGTMKRFRCKKLPPYIIVHYKRFTKNHFVEEKNPTIVNFPVRGADFRDVLENTPPGTSTIYDLVANVTHESTAGTARDKENTAWKVHLRAPPLNTEGNEASEARWLMMQDLIVEETAKELIFLGETVLQVCFPSFDLSPLASEFFDYANFPAAHFLVWLPISTAARPQSSPWL
ncbi:cysteine proteinase [Clavulina sp. PMI_390]|nr:cysteine proteinase [Clavulina sp. PMI_390]